MFLLQPLIGLVDYPDEDDSDEDATATNGDGSGNGPTNKRPRLVA